MVSPLSPLQIKAESAAHALGDAGLAWSDVDAIYDAGDGGGMSGLTIAEYFGLKPKIIDTTNVGGSSYELHAAHAKQAIAAGNARVALLSDHSTSPFSQSCVARGVCLGTFGRSGIVRIPVC